ncbi:TolC family outer membrane protein [Ovoidimarina sediminis]|uniref:TolC family outer membrane protein n=1 Tax=Ovoidimarina sediminis TaxID=3079856 RepID=UPI0029079BEB|nr:TolC family outer membrane protein [Rhodophyticola sp. MJ-SS7]MDU8944943.1 TolC family outer membrane protein [Rhodophyticola sp. MJ-SS7]
MGRMTLKSLLCATALAVATALPAGAQSLTDTLINAYRTSDLLDQNRALLRAADEDVAQSVSSLRPVLEYVGRVSYSDPSIGDHLTGNVGLEASLLLFDFGRSQLTIDLQKETVLALREGLKGIEQDVLLRGVNAYFNVRLQNAFVGLRENDVRVITQQLRAARDRFEVGEVTRTDVSIAEARLAAARSGFAAAQGALAQAREEYKAVTGAYPMSLRPPPPAPRIPASEAEAKGIALGRHPDILEAQRNVTVSEIGIAVARAALNPTLRGTVGVSLDEDGDDASSVGVTLRGPIYSGGNISSVIRQSQARRDASRASLHFVNKRIEQGVGNAWADLAVSVASERASEEEVRAARLALRGAQEELEVGSRTTLDVLDLEQDLLDAQTNLISAQINRAVTIYELLAAMGLLTVDHLALGVATYDPAAYYNAVKNAPLGTVTSPQGEKLDRVMRRLNLQ